jgi:hypothetical protein
MAVLKKDNKVRKWEQRIKAAEASNPKLAEKLRGKLASFKGRKD